MNKTYLIHTGEGMNYVDQYGKVHSFVDVVNMIDNGVQIYFVTQEQMDKVNEMELNAFEAESC